MNYNYPQQQFQPQQSMGYVGGYRPNPQQYPSWIPPINNSQQVRPVSSIEEVRACPIDFDGSVFYFADVANKKIYTKQINLDGTVAINVYELKTDQVTNSSQYVTRQEFEEVINQLYQQLKPAEIVQQPAVQPSKQEVQEQKPRFEI